eukprot:2795038-Rhodomonas_salina.1
MRGQGLKQYWEKTSALVSASSSEVTRICQSAACAHDASFASSLSLRLLRQLSDEEQKQAIVGKVEATAGAVAGLMGDAKEQLGAVVAKTSSK